MTAEKRNFIVIDDNKLDRFIVEKLIKTFGKSERITLFSDARDALNLIKKEAHVIPLNKTVIIVDIQMPFMNGFEFVEAFEELEQQVKSNYIIFILSSTINQSDLNRVANYKSVKNLISKPLTVKIFTQIIDQLSESGMSGSGN